MGKFKNLLQRSISGAIFVAILVGSISWSPYAFLFVFALITGLGLYEFHKLTNKPGEIDVNSIAAVFGGLLLFICSHLYVSDKVPYFIFFAYLFYVIIIFLCELFRKKKNPVHNWAYFFLGQTYIAAPFSLLNFILYIQGYQPFILLAVFITIWVNDSGAYISGMALGKHKLFERISPKKTWEGFFGGAVFTLISAYLLSRYIPDISLVEWIVFSELIVVFGTLGDLSESLLKRSENVKDAGNIIPGHGGILDRFDSMIIAVPIIFIFLNLILKL